MVLFHFILFILSFLRTYLFIILFQDQRPIVGKQVQPFSLNAQKHLAHLARSHLARCCLGCFGFRVFLLHMSEKSSTNYLIFSFISIILRYEGRSGSLMCARKSDNI